MLFNKIYDVPEPIYTDSVSVKPEPDIYLKKAIEKGLGLPPAKEYLMPYQEYGAKCMLLGYQEGKRRSKKKYKKAIKKLQAKLKERTPLGVLKNIENNDVSGLSFVFEPNIEDCEHKDDV